MSAKTILTMIVFITMIGGTFGQRTDNCTTRAYKGYTPCGDNKCCCIYKRAVCSGFGPELTYIPRLQQRISHLLFVGNYLPVLTKTHLSNISTENIPNLSLANNSIQNISADAFSDFGNLKHLTLVGNKLTVLSIKPFRSLNLLYTINLKDNQIQDIVNDAIQPSLRHINLANNVLVSEVRHHWFCSPDGKPIFPSLNEIEFAGNFITKLTNDSFKCLGSLQQLGLNRNIVQVIHPNAFASLQYLYKLQFSYIRQSISDISNCAFNNSHMEYFTFRENYINILPNVADIIFQHSTNIRVLDISLNSLGKLTPDQILGMFRPLKRLETLHAERCHIKALPTNFFSFFRNLTELTLNGNSIHTLGYFRNVYNLRFLSLEGNIIHGVKKHEVSDKFMNSLEYMSLTDNPFDCTCELLWFRSMINDGEGKFGNISLLQWPYRYSCHTPSKLKYTRLVNYKPTTFSCTNVFKTLAISLGAVLVLATIVCILSYRYRWHIKYRFYKLKGHRTNPETRPLLDPDNQAFDGYVIYHTEDSQFVHHDLSLFMEEKHGHKLHIWERNAPAGCSNLEGMIDGIHASKHAIAVISKKSIQDSWIKFQMDVALGMQVELERDFLILVILENVEFKSLSKYWCLMLTKQNAARWYPVETDVKYAVFEQQMTNHLGTPRQAQRL